MAREQGDDPFDRALDGLILRVGRILCYNIIHASTMDDDRLCCCLWVSIWFDSELVFDQSGDVLKRPCIYKIEFAGVDHMSSKVGLNWTVGRANVCAPTYVSTLLEAGLIQVDSHVVHGVLQLGNPVQKLRSICFRDLSVVLYKVFDRGKVSRQRFEDRCLAWVVRTQTQKGAEIHPSAMLQDQAGNDCCQRYDIWVWSQEIPDLFRGVDDVDVVDAVVWSGCFYHLICCCLLLFVFLLLIRVSMTYLYIMLC